jgi:hypothetical protein
MKDKHFLYHAKYSNAIPRLQTVEGRSLQMNSSLSSKEIVLKLFLERVSRMITTKPQHLEAMIR